MARKATTLQYPRSRTFTLADLVDFNDGVSIQTVRKYVRLATDAGSLRVKGRKPSCGRGRPCFVFERA